MANRLFKRDAIGVREAAQPVFGVGGDVFGRAANEALSTAHYIEEAALPVGILADDNRRDPPGVGGAFDGAPGVLLARLQDVAFMLKMTAVDKQKDYRTHCNGRKGQQSGEPGRFGMGG